jgi:hypothetical protein
MESTYKVPVPKQPSPQLTRDDRLRIQTLFFDANHTRAQICLETPYTYDQICYAITHCLTPQKRKTKGRILLNTPQRKRLIQWVTASKENRETPWIEIPAILGLNCGEYAIRSAFKKEGFARRISQKKPPLSEANRLERLAWAIEHYDWPDEKWDEILWSDETWTQPGRHTRTWITRLIGEKEVYEKDCVQPRYQRRIGWMFWGSISGKYGRHRAVFWEKDWETINEGSYSGIIIPVVDEILQEYPELQFQQDNAKGHASAFTKSVLKAAGIRVIKWPPNSPDLNPIETLWDDMKDYIQEHYPQVHRSYKRLREAVQEAWNSITHERIRELVHSMRERCLAVIKARGWYTKY